MFACICRAVTTDQVNAAIDSGASTLSAVARATLPEGAAVLLVSHPLILHVQMPGGASQRVR